MKAGAVLETIIAGEAIQGEKSAVRKFHRARIFMGHAEIGELRRRDDLHPWRDLLRAAKRLSDKRPAHVYRRRRDAAGFPAACSPVDRGFGEDILIAMIQVAAQIAGKGDFRSAEHTSELQSLMRNSYAVFCLQKKNT